MNWYQYSAENLAEKLDVNMDKGLSSKQAESRLKKLGPNKLEEGKSINVLLLFFRQFQDFMVLVLLAATLISGLLGEYVDAVAIMAIVFVNAVLGFFQEQKAEKSLSKLKELSAPHAQVLRDGSWIKVPSADLVMGDIVKVTSGDRLSADLRLIKTSGLEVEESSLTGESLPVLKHENHLMDETLELGDQANMAFSGTLVTRGSGVGVVVGTGMKTAMGQIASLLVQTSRKPTPLERKLAELGKILIFTALLLTAFVVVVGVYRGHPLYEMFLAGVSLAVAAIPEGLPAIVTVALSLGVQRMIKKKAIVRKLSAVETLGCASVICSDKTGTMTENQMTVKQVSTIEDHLYVTGEGYDPFGAFFERDIETNVREIPGINRMLLYGSLCNHASILKRDDRYLVDGDPTEGALKVVGYKAGITEEQMKEWKVTYEIPFDSDRKRMTVIAEHQNGERVVIVKGAPDVLLPRSTSIYSSSGQRPLKPKDEREVENILSTMTNQALRTIAICYKTLKKGQSYNNFELEKDLTFMGITGIIDPPRKEVKRAIDDCRQAGIKTVMITGDHAKTAHAIARDLELMPEGGRVVEGAQLSSMSDDQLEAIIDETYVFARVTPHHKLRIVNAFQNRGHVVAMTGDGVNDAPAIKASDIGISMGQSGTDVAKEASSLVLLDDNFATIRSAIQEGRNIYENIRKFIRYLLASNVGEILVMLFAMFLALPLPLVPVQILWVNLVTDGLPAMALGLDQSERNVMKRPPRSPGEGVFARGLGFKIISRGFMIGIVTLIAFMMAYQGNPERLLYAQTVAFSTLVVAQLIHVFDCRSERSVFARNPFSNLYLLGAVLSSVLLMLVVIYYDPLHEVFHTMDLPIRDWLFITALGAIPTFLWGFSKK
ncbi:MULTISPECIES: calcium-translocating P-type ATPase, SERCA-type [Pontibacillus]|uniref:Calcium-translocating P-type ATPase, SERCA-type n=1 Tax=Pontibacillus chungwhensis TaxID=265426 RepID=A0ABY8V1R2_9BACI|nr:calcium-translocating P-type ATPase, SERCA-type [Pontibacillus chungwhensis]MCD5322624.1 calcium-translocating P-type ATPase, SERCA-type [Pontibacillus sp. HN14]WIF99906.1 calcium-translocating P-type ATPase, SERCA-type [Pontibacillus chungwhensis]